MALEGTFRYKSSAQEEAKDYKKQDYRVVIKKAKPDATGYKWRLYSYSKPLSGRNPPYRWMDKNGVMHNSSYAVAMRKLTGHKR